MNFSMLKQPLFSQKNGKKNIAAAKLVIMGAVCGDIIGSWYEFAQTKDYNFELFTHRSKFTDDTVCSIGIADALVHQEPFEIRLQYWCRKYPGAGYGGMFRKWIYSDTMEPYNSWGNGSAMRVSAVGAYANTFDETMDLAKKSAEITHNDPEGIKGAQATALAIYLALTGKSKDEIKNAVEEKFDYNLSRRYNDIQPDYGFDVSCQESVPESIIAFLESDDYESAIRKAIAFGGDADTMGAITGGIAAAFYGEIPPYILNECLNRLPDEMKEVISKFNDTIG